MSKFKNNQTNPVTEIPKRKVQTWDLMKQNAIEGARKGDRDSIKELRELRKIERKSKKNTSPGQQTLTK